MYTIFPWIFTILYFQQNQILNKFGIFVNLMYWNFPLNFHNFARSSIFHRIFTKLDIQWIWIFLQIRTIWTSNFQLNFHNFVLSMKSNLSTISDYLYIFCTQFSVKFSWFGTFIDSPLNFHKFVDLMNSIFFTIPNDLYI